MIKPQRTFWTSEIHENYFAKLYNQNSKHKPSCSTNQTLHCLSGKKLARVLSLTFDFQNIGRKKQRQQNHLFHQHFIPWGHNGLQRPILFLDKFPKQSSHYKYYWHVL